jgi:lantibiotic leader peptide-processing serine protease
MHLRSLRTLALAAVGALALSACAPDAESPLPLFPEHGPSLSVSDLGVPLSGRFLILGQGNGLPANLAAQVTAAGGRLTSVIPEIGVAFAEPLRDDFASRMARVRGIESVTPDIVLENALPGGARSAEEVSVGASSVAASSATLADNAFFYSFQWAPRAVQAPEAWGAGFTGRGVRIAILDGGLYDAHLDLSPNVDRSVSRSFVPGVAWNQDVGTFWHGTHVAGIAAASGMIGTTGIAPNATLIGVKVLHSGSGAFEWILNGIVYAATPRERGGAGAHVMNMSLGATIDYRGNWSDKDFRTAFRELQKAYDRGTRYATQQGTVVIASAGNDATNYDVAKNLFKFPAQNQHVISISATGPHGWALGATDFARPAYYTDHGKSLVDLAAPGGTIGLWLVDGVDQVCTVPGTFITIANFCEVFDQVMSTVRGTTVASYNWAQGTSMAAPAAAGVAALIIERNGGSMNPQQVRTALQRSAIDLGKPGNDEFYGHGWINAFRAVTQ